MKKLVALPAAIGLLLTFVYVGIANAAPDANAVSTVTAGSLTLKDTLVDVAGNVLPFAAAIVAIGIGWRLARRFVRA